MEFPSPEIQDKSSNLTLLQQQVVDFFVDGVRVLGLPRSLGEIYGILYISTTPLSLDDLVRLLGISKGSASQGLRTLRTLGAIRETIKNGDRKTYYEPAVDLKRLVGGFIREQVRPHLDSGKARLELIQETALNSADSADREFFTERIDRLESWAKRGGQVLPVLQKFLGQ
ncbi:GbsR/MarR family transcriptional regulator [Luteolibacter sp. AS25]|uniref:GbsR/MarR family transcriptional regulator n=1 Tax=Luteolibacter sp. AS25 TaxID=3135776 RepID=UPI00398B987C